MHVSFIFDRLVEESTGEKVKVDLTLGEAQKAFDTSSMYDEAPALNETEGG